MKFVFLYDNGRLHPVAEKVRSEQYEVENNINRVTGSTSIVITDKPFSATIYNNFCIGGSKFSESLLNTSYHNVILEMNNIEKSTVPSNTYISCWFNGVDFVFPAVISINEDKFMEGNKGVTVDSMGCTLCVCGSKKRGFTETLLKFKSLLRKVSYCGFFTLSCVFKENSVQVAKIEPYFKYDLLYAFLEGTQGEIGKSLHEISIGGKKEFKFPEMYAIAVRISIPPYPYSHIKTKHVVLKGVCAENEKHIWAQNTVRDEKGQIVSDTKYGVIATVTARGASVRECIRRVYRTVENLSIEDMQYRRDVGAKAEDVFKELRERNWI